MRISPSSMWRSVCLATSTTEAYRGWMHDSQFVLRLPNHWNGKLVVTGAPAVRGTARGLIERAARGP